MISESKLLEIESQAEVFSMLTFPAETVKQLLAAARVANAAAHNQRERWDKKRRGWESYEGGEVFIERADWNLGRALTRYTQLQTRKANA